MQGKWLMVSNIVCFCIKLGLNVILSSYISDSILLLFLSGYHCRSDYNNDVRTPTHGFSSLIAPDCPQTVEKGLDHLIMYRWTQVEFLSLSGEKNIYLKIPYYAVFHEFHRAVRGPTTLYSKCNAPYLSMVLNFSCLKAAQVSSTAFYWGQAVSVPAPLNANELHLSTPALPATRPSQAEDAAYASGSMR